MAEFECSDGIWYEDEVQDFIQDRALAETLDEDHKVYVDVPSVALGDPAGPNTSAVWSPRLLLFFDEDELIAVAGHRPEMLNLGDSRFILAIGLRVLALGNPYKGRYLDNGPRLSDAVMGALLNDAVGRTGEPVVATAVVAIDNLRSVTLCERHGLHTQIRHGHRHARLIGQLGSDAA